MMFLTSTSSNEIYMRLDRAICFIILAFKANRLINFQFIMSSNTAENGIPAEEASFLYYI